MNQYVLSVNAGSSSVKFCLYQMPEEKVLLSGMFDGVNSEQTVFKAKFGGDKQQLDLVSCDFAHAAEFLLKFITDNQILTDLSALAHVGHRVTHGGEHYHHSVIIDDDVIRHIDELSILAPLHNPVNLQCIQVFRQALPDAVQVAVFDTAFHQTIEPSQYLYALPYELYREHGIRRYGFHGISHNYVSKVVQDEFAGLPGLKLINCHLGNGASICAMSGGASVMTSMGFTPLAGLMMGTRCGDIDPALPAYIAQVTGKDMQEVVDMMNTKSGLLGVSQISNDSRQIEEAAEQEDAKAMLAQEMFVNRVAETIGAYAAVLNGINVLTFSGGIGENSSDVRRRVCEKLAYLGVGIDSEANCRNQEQISHAASKVTVKVVKTNEELMIARDVFELSAGLMDKKQCG